MDYVKLIAEVGFPIICVIVLARFIHQLYKDSVKREEDLKVELAESRAVNAKAIDTLATYANRLDSIQHDVEEIKDDIAGLIHTVQ